MASSNYFASFGENSDPFIPNYNRTFEDLVTERGDMPIIFTSESESNVNYNIIFDKIKSKLFKLNTVNNTNIHNFDDIKKFKDEFTELKKSTCVIYMNFMKTETELNNAKEKYTTFCEHLKNCIHSINLCGKNDDTDILIKQMLEKKIEQYYTNLDMDKLIENYNNANTEFEKLKYKINTISGSIIPSTTCQICLENQVEYFIDPCGHTICKSCKTLCETNTLCHYCRTIKTRYKRLYI
jgi:hypothetical protein